MLNDDAAKNYYPITDARPGRPWVRCAASGLALACLIFSSLASAQAESQWIKELGGRATEDAAGQVTAVDFRHCWLTDADLQRVGKLQYVHEIQLGYTKITDQGLEYLKPLANVRSLDLMFAESISDAGVAHLKQWSKLERLNLHGTKVTSTVFDHLVDMKQLVELDVAFTRVNDDNFEQLSALPRLQRLSIGGNKMSGVALPLLKLVPSLRHLNVGGQQRTDSGLWSVAITDANCQHIAALTQLQSLDLSDTAVTDRGLSRLATLKNLERLRLTRTKITAKSIQALQGMDKLQELNCTGCEGIDDSAKPVFMQMPNLKSLLLEGTK